MSIPMSATAIEIQESGAAYVRYCRVESWLNGELLHADVTVVGGREDVDRSARIPERVTLSVPRYVDGYDWSPVDSTHPLAAFGQRLRIMLGVGLAGEQVEWIQRGEYLINSAERRGDVISVEAVGLLALIDEAKLVAPYQPTGTLISTLRGLVEPALTVVFDAGLVDRAVPAGINYDEDRLGAVSELLDAWPAEASINNEGYLQVGPVVTQSDIAILLGPGTTISAPGESSRQGAVNCVVARGTASDGAQVQGVAYEYGTGPYRFGGPFNPLPVPAFFASPLLTTVSACKLAATTRLQKIMRERASTRTVTAVPLVHLQVGDQVIIGQLEPDGSLLQFIGFVEAMTMPLLAGEGAMTLTVVERT